MPVTTGQLKKGTRIESLNFGWMEAVSEPYPSGLSQGNFRIDVRFDDTGNIRTGVVDRYFVGGYVRDGSVQVSKDPGASYRTINSGVAEVVEYVSTKELIVRFVDTGNFQEVQLDALVTGTIKDQKHFSTITSNKMAEESRLKFERDATDALARAKRQKEEAERKLAREKVLAAWKTKREAEALRARQHFQRLATRKAERLSNVEKILKLEVKDLNHERVCKGVLNIDFKDRDGNWVLRFKMGAEFVQTRLGKLHNNVTQRVKKEGSYSTFSSAYVNVGISNSFLDPQRFCDWAVAQKGWGMGYQLEKDLLSGDNKIYSEDTCVFLPREINSALIPVRAVSLTRSAQDGYTLCGSLGGKEILVPGFETKDAALDAYRKYREAYVRRLAVEYKEAISPRAFDALMNWELKMLN